MPENPIQDWLEAAPYPTAVENWWMDKLRTHFSSTVDADVLDRLRPAVQALSDRFTTERDAGFGTYQEDRLTDLAYGLFFFPQSFVRAQLPILEALKYRSLTLPDQPIKILDLGCGQGPASLGIAYLLRQLGCQQPIHILAQDHVPAVAGHARDLIRDLPEVFSDVSIELQAGTLNPENKPQVLQEGPWDFIILGFVLNELPQYDASIVADWLDQLGSHLNDAGQLLILEPSLQGTSQRLHRIRNTLLEQRSSLHLLGPCLHREACPLLAEGKFWCHEVRNWQANESMEYLNRKLFRDLQTLKFSYLLWGRSPGLTPKPDASHFRLVSPFSEMKGRFLFRGCATDGQVHDYDLPTRGLKKSGIKALKKDFSRGDLLKTASMDRNNAKAPWRLGAVADLKSFLDAD